MYYKTVNLKQATYQKLLKYKSMGNSFDDVINTLIDEVDPLELYEQNLDEHKRIIREMDAGEYTTLDELKKKLKVK